MVNLSFTLSVLGAALVIPKQALFVEGGDPPENPVIAVCGKSAYVGGTVIADGTAGCHNDHEIFVDPEATLLSVRCCSDVDLGGRWKLNHGCTAFAGTIDITETRCPRKMTYSQAEQYCTYAGGRLCTANEVVSDCTAGTGCRFDSEMIWTSSTDYSKVQDPVVVTCGNSLFVGGELKAKRTAGCFTEHQVLVERDSGLRLNVRCCADTYLGLPWAQAPQCSVWSTTQFIGEECNPKMLLTEATEYCESRGGRLCTTEEVYKDCTVGTGCNYDTEQIWTSSTEIYVQSMVTACGRSDYVNGYEVSKHTDGCGAEHEKLVIPDIDNKAAVRCCSDVDLGDPWLRNSGCSVWAATRFLNGQRCPGKMTFFDAEDFCAAAGGRLCTTEEVVRDCAMGTGCDYDTAMIWTSSTDMQLYLPAVEPVVTACGYSQYVGGEVVTQNTKGCLKDLEVLRHPGYSRAVRCCSDFDLGAPWVKNPGCSIWALAARNPDNDQECAEKMDYYQAEAYCASLGARLCASLEVVNDCAAGTGCGFDTEMVWTSSTTTVY